MKLRQLAAATILAPQTIAAQTVAALAIAAWLAPAPAQAQPVDGYYIGAGAGGNMLADQKFRASAGLRTPSLTLRDDIGWVGLGSIGYGFGNGFRMELEGNYRQNHVSKFTGTSFPTTASGTTEQYGAMVNGLFDTDIGVPWMFPYIGAGVGYGWEEQSSLRIRNATDTAALSAHGTYGDFAYQGILGAAFPVPMTPGLSATLEYRYYGILGPRSFRGTSVDIASASAGGNSGNLDARDDSGAHSILIGLRYAFNTAPPPPPPAPAPVAAPAPAPSRTYLVFFDWDRADLTDRARQIIHEAADNSTRVQYTRIQVNGYTDLSGTATYNQRLSVRRAQSVAAELVRDGVPRNAINIQGFGESNPLVPTAKGVREPQNRRVEIVIQ